MGKKCFKCSVIKPITEFYKHKEMADGHLNKCKQCTKDDSNKHRSDNIESVREYDRKRGQSPKRKQRNKDYQNNMKENNHEEWTKMRRDACKKSREKNREKFIANSRLRYAVKTNKIKKLPCSICGDIKSEAHHPDYQKPLEVIWLCDFHHKEEHKRLREIERNKIL